MVYNQQGFRLKFSDLKTLEGWLRLHTLLRPKLYNKITWFLVVAGVSILTTSLIEALISELLDRAFDIPLLDGYETVTGLGVIIAALTYNLACQYMETSGQRAKDLQQAAKNDEHDREMFLKLDAQLEEVKLRQILSWIDTHEFYSKDQWSELNEFVYEGEKTSNQMLNHDIEEARTSLINSIDSLTSFMAVNFFYRSGQRSREDSNHYLYPDFNPDLDGDFENDNLAFYGRKSEELSELIAESEGAYTSYRKLVKKRLHC